MNRITNSAFVIAFALATTCAIAADDTAPAAPNPESAPAAPAPHQVKEMQVHAANLSGFDPISVPARISADQIQTIFSMVDTGNQQFTNGNYFAAVHAFKVAEAVDPGNLTLLKPLGRACVESEFYDDAVAALEPVRASNPGDEIANAALVRAYIGLLDIAMFENEFEQAEALLQKILGIEPTQEKAKSLVSEAKVLTAEAKVTALRGTAAALRERKRNPIAATRLERLLELAPQDYEALVQLADTYGALRLYDKAEDVYRRAIAVKESPEEDRKRLDAYLWGQAQYGLDLKEYTKAIVALEKLRAAHPEDTKVLVELAKAFLGADEGRPDNAVPTVQKAKEMAPNSAQVAIALAEVYKASEQMGLAISSLAEAAPSSDDPGLTYKTLGLFQAEIATDATADKAIIDKANADKAEAERIAAEKTAAAAASSERLSGAKAESGKLMAEKTGTEQALTMKTEAMSAANQMIESAKASLEIATNEKTSAEQALSTSTGTMNAVAEKMNATQAGLEKTSAEHAAAQQSATAMATALMAATLAVEEAKIAGETANSAKSAAESALAEKGAVADAAADALAAIQADANRAGELESAQAIAITSFAGKTEAESQLAQMTEAATAAVATVTSAVAEMEKATEEKTQADRALAQMTEALTARTSAMETARSEMAKAVADHAAAEAMLVEKTDALGKANESMSAAVAASEKAASEKTEVEQQLAQATDAASMANEKVAALMSEVEKANAEKSQADDVAKQKADAVPAAIASTASSKRVAEKAAAEKAANDVLAVIQAEVEAATAAMTNFEGAASEKGQASKAAADQLAAKEAELTAAVAAKTEADNTFTAMAQAAQVAADAMATAMSEAESAAASYAKAQETETAAAQAEKPEAEKRTQETAAALKAAEEKTTSAKSAHEESMRQKAQAEIVAAEKTALVQAITEQAAAMKPQVERAATEMAAAEKAKADGAAALEAARVELARNQKIAERLASLRSKAEHAATPDAIVARAAESGAAAYGAYKSSGLAYVSAKLWSPALQSFGEAIKHNAAGDIEFFHHYGFAYFNMPNRNRGALDESVKFLTKVTELDGQHLPSYSLLGDVYMSINDPTWTRRGVQSLEKATELNPNDADLFYRLGKAYARDQRQVKAYGAYARAVELAPDNQEYLRQSMQAFVDDNRFENALALLNGRDPASLSIPIQIARGDAMAGLEQWEAVRELCAELAGKTEDKTLRGQIGALDSRAKSGIAAHERVGGEKLVLVLFGEGVESARTWRDPERDAIPRLWNDLMPLGELREAVSLEDRYQPEEIASALVTGQWPITPETGLTYYQHVRPTLMRFCADCHNQDKPKGGFVVDDPAAMLLGGEEHAEKVIVPGKGKGSYLVQCVTAMNMPPKKPLKNARVTDLLTKWIDQGAHIGEPVTNWILEAPTLFERYRAGRTAAPEKVWSIVGSPIYEPLRASISPAFGEVAAPTFVSTPALRETMNRFLSLLAEADKRNMERTERLALVAQQTSEGLGISLGNDSANQLVTGVAKRAYYLGQSDDQLAYAIAKSALQTHKPDVMFLAFGQPREDSSPEDICRADAAVYGLWNELNLIPEYRNNTNFVVVTPVPRENTAYILRIGPRVPAGAVDRGRERVWNRPIVLTELMTELADILGIDYEIPEADLKPS